MGREARVQAGLAGTDVPVAKIVLHDGGELIGIQCYVMEKVPGHVIRGELPRGYATTDSEREPMAFTFVATLAALHAVDQDAVRLGDSGRPAGFMERQVRPWTGPWAASRTHTVDDTQSPAHPTPQGVPRPTPTTTPPP